MSDPKTPDPRYDPAAPRAPLNPPYSDPALDPRPVNQTVVQQPSGGRGGLIAAGILAVLVVIGIVAFTSTPSTDPGTTAVIPEQTEEMAPAPEAAPAEPATPAPEAGAPLDDLPADAAPAGQAPAADQ